MDSSDSMMVVVTGAAVVAVGTVVVAVGAVGAVGTAVVAVVAVGAVRGAGDVVGAADATVEGRRATLLVVRLSGEAFAVPQAVRMTARITVRAGLWRSGTWRG